jgi:DNA-3-methyladenine glycosylase II
MSIVAKPRKRAAVADRKAREFLRNADPVLARLIDARPGFRPRAWLDELPPLDAFGTLIFQIAGQQLSVAATRTMVSRLQERFGGHLPSPAELLAADPEVLRASGLSYRKGATLRALAERFVDGRLSDEAFSRMTDDEVEAALTEVPGIGPWTAHGFLLVALDRPDVFLTGDSDDAKAAVLALFEDAGFAVIDLGDLATGGAMQQIHHPLAGVNLIRLA